MIDLHTHSSISDGSMTPAELIGYAKEKGLSALALTDHDTVGGLEQAEKTASDLSFSFIPGIEIEITYAPGVFHVLGLGLKYWRDVIPERLEQLKKYRYTRNQRIIEKMRKSGINIDYSDVEAVSGGDIVARPHFARVLVERGIARSIKDAFERFLGTGQPFYEPIKTLSLSEAIELIHDGGGKSILAHPQSLYLSKKNFLSSLTEWKKMGLDGIEAYHSNLNIRKSMWYEKTALEYSLIVSAGSDFHGKHRPDRKLGRTSSGIKIEDRFLTSFL
ncbi:MAG: PHP domain-containing protein [Spirochaetia bacterium]